MSKITAKCTIPVRSVWSGYVFDIYAEIIDETPTRYRVRILSPGRWPGRSRSAAKGDIKLVPKHRVCLSRMEGPPTISQKSEITRKMIEAGKIEISRFAYLLHAATAKGFDDAAAMISRRVLEAAEKVRVSDE